MSIYNRLVCSWIPSVNKTIWISLTTPQILDWSKYPWIKILFCFPCISKVSLPRGLKVHVLICEYTDKHGQTFWHFPPLYSLRTCFTSALTMNQRSWSATSACQRWREQATWWPPPAGLQDTWVSRPAELWLGWKVNSEIIIYTSCLTTGFNLICQWAQVNLNQLPQASRQQSSPACMSPEWT